MALSDPRRGARQGPSARARLRPDSLFARLMVAQATIAALLGLLFLMWLTAARTHAVAHPYARLWEHGFAQAAAQPLGDDQPPMLASAGYPLQRRATLPEGQRTIGVEWLPGLREWKREFAIGGVDIDAVRLGWKDGGLVYWFHVQPIGREGLWLGLVSIPVWPAFNRYNITVSLLMLAVMGGLSWRFARRVTRPLEALHRRLESDMIALSGSDADAQAAAAVPLPRLDAAASAEVTAIDAAYRQLIDRLRRTERERALLLAGVSHDLRSPLGRIRLTAEMLKPGQDTQVATAAITRNVDYADRLIGSFLDYVRAGTLAMDAPVDVAAAAEAVVARLGRPAEELCWLPNPTAAGPQTGDPGTVLPRANALLIDRLIFNLVDNALTHGTAPVVVRTAVGPDGIVIDVADAGAGLPAGQEAALMQAFARADASRHVPGSGLGLTVVQQIVVRLGGILVFERDAAGHHARVMLPVGPRPDV